MSKESRSHHDEGMRRPVLKRAFRASSFALLSSFVIRISSLAATPPAPGAADDAAVARYRDMLAKNPAEGIVLDRLWKAWQERGATGELLAQYGGDATFSGRMIHGLLLRRAGDDAGARKAFQEAAALDPASAQPFLAMADVLQNTPAAAAVALEAAAKLQPSPETLLKLGSAWLAAGERDKAAGAWERAVALNPGDPALRRQLAQVCEAGGLREKALPHFGFLAEHGDPAEQAQALQDIARVQEALGKNDEAVAALDRALRLVAPGNWMRRGIEARMIRLHERAGKLDDLETLWKKQAAENPRDLAPCVQLADFYEHLADAAQCRVWLEKAVALDPKDAATRLRLARILAELNEPDAAGKIYDALLRERPGDNDALFALCEIFIQQDQPRAARERIERRLAQSPDDGALRARAIDFCTRHRLFDVVERQLRGQAAGDEAGVLALANFYFDQRRNREAVETLGGLVKKDAPAAEQAAALGRVADVLRERGDSGAALATLRRGVALAPGSAPLQAQLGGLLTALGRSDEALAAFEAAWRAEPSEANDRKIYDLLSMSPPDESDRHKPRGTAANARTREYALGLSKALSAGAEKKPGDMLRVARWLFWTGENGLACAMCAQVWEADADSVEARELFIKAALAKGDRNAAITRLRELVRLQPAREVELLRRMAGLMLDAGQADDALAILCDVARKNPGNLDALLDIARALQRADRWYDALPELERAFAIAPPDRRPEVARALVATCDRLQLRDKAAEFLLRALDAEPPGESRKRLLDELMARADRPATTRWLLGEFGKRHALHPDDYATAEALAEIYKRNGEEDAAFALLREAAENAPDEAAGLRAVVREAVERGDPDTALALQRRVAFIGRNRGMPDETMALAEIQEDAPDADGAAATWRALARRFPRDPRTLVAAADFFLRWDFRDDARGLLRSVRALDPLNLDALAKLARVTDSDAEAISCRDQILRSSDAEAASDPLVFPGLPGWARERMRGELLIVIRERSEQISGASAQALRGFWTEPGAGVSAARELRLESIRDIAARLRASGDKAALRAWLARWQAADGRSEPLWALFHAGAGAETLAHVAKLTAADPSDGRLASAFAWCGLTLGEFRRVGAWVADENSGPLERDAFLVALAQFLDAGPAPEDLAAALFPADFAGRSLLLESAAILAAHGSLRGAVELGARALAATRTEPAGTGLALARWHAELGDAGGAQRVLRRSIEGGGDSYDQPLYAAMRAYWLLLGPEERESFLNENDAASATATRPTRRIRWTRCSACARRRSGPATVSTPRQAAGSGITFSRRGCT
jgi:tetratricopeptide (TPR) repeat protein